MGVNNFVVVVFRIWLKPQWKVNTENDFILTQSISQKEALKKKRAQMGFHSNAIEELLKIKSLTVNN